MPNPSSQYLNPKLSLFHLAFSLKHLVFIFFLTVAAHASLSSSSLGILAQDSGLEWSKKYPFGVFCQGPCAGPDIEHTQGDRVSHRFEFSFLFYFFLRLTFVYRSTKSIQGLGFTLRVERSQAVFGNYSCEYFQGFRHKALSAPMAFFPYHLFLCIYRQDSCISQPFLKNPRMRIFQSSMQRK